MRTVIFLTLLGFGIANPIGAAAETSLADLKETCGPIVDKPDKLVPFAKLRLALFQDCTAYLASTLDKVNKPEIDAMEKFEAGLLSEGINRAQELTDMSTTAVQNSKLMVERLRSEFHLSATDAAIMADILKSDSGSLEAMK